jgi:hypothetical protein
MVSLLADGQEAQTLNPTGKKPGRQEASMDVASGKLAEAVAEAVAEWRLSALRSRCRVPSLDWPPETARAGRCPVAFHPVGAR